MTDNIKLTGRAIIQRKDKNNNIIDTIEINNLIVNTGKERVAGLINGVSTLFFKAIAIGTDSTSPSGSNTALLAEVKRELATLTYVAPNQAVFEHTFTFTSTYSICEAGILDNEVSGGVLLNRLIFSARSVSSLINLYIKIIITVS